MRRRMLDAGEPLASFAREIEQVLAAIVSCAEIARASEAPAVETVTREEFDALARHVRERDDAIEGHAQGLDALLSRVTAICDCLEHPEPPPKWAEYLGRQPFTLDQRVEVCGAIVAALEPEYDGPPRPRPRPEPEPESAVTVEAIVAECAKGRAA